MYNQELMDMVPKSMEIKKYQRLVEIEVETKDLEINMKEGMNTKHKEEEIYIMRFKEQINQFPQTNTNKA